MKGQGRETGMNYRLMHKNVAVMEIGIDQYTNSITKIGTVNHIEHLPVGIQRNKHGVDPGSLNRWWATRAIPASRSGIREALELMDVQAPQMLLTKCLGLSLSDQYWVCPAESSVKWEQVNFFQNPFSEDVGNALFGKGPDSGAFDLMSPDNTSDGWLRKKWKIINGKRCLMKSGSNPYQQEPLNEILASSIQKRLGIEGVTYGLTWEDGVPFSICEDFVTPTTELISAYHVYQTQKKENHVSVYQQYLKCCEQLGVPDVMESLDRMLVLDYLIGNTDRHMNNFGLFRNADTLEWIGAAPIFDCGTSMWHDQVTSMIRPGKDIPAKPFRSKQSEQIKLVTSYDWIQFEALAGIAEEWNETLKQSEYMEPARKDVLCYGIQSRIRLLEEFVQQQEKGFSIGLQ